MERQTDRIKGVDGEKERKTIKVVDVETKGMKVVDGKKQNKGSESRGTE